MSLIMFTVFEGPWADFFCYNANGLWNRDGSGQIRPLRGVSEGFGQKGLTTISHMAATSGTVETRPQASQRRESWR